MGLGALLRGLIAALPLGATALAAAVALQGNPLARPFVERGEAELGRTLERMVRRTADDAWMRAALEDAVEAGDAGRAGMLVALAADLGLDVDTGAAQALIAASDGWAATAAACGACMADIASCPSLELMGACGVPFELSPLGDLNALRRAGTDWMAGRPVDELDASLALVGLAATGAVVVSGGSSATVKAGAGLLRTARRLGSLTPGMARLLRLPIRWEAVPGLVTGATRIEDVTDAARLATLGGVASDMARVRAATSTAEALRLARLVDTPDDAARLARVAEAAGPRTTRTFAVLGKGRTFRATVRLGRAAAGTLVLLWLTAAQLAAVIGVRIGALLLRGAARAAQRSRRAPVRVPPARRHAPLGPAGPPPPWRTG